MSGADEVAGVDDVGVVVGVADAAEFGVTVVLLLMIHLQSLTAETWLIAIPYTTLLHSCVFSCSFFVSGFGLRVPLLSLFFVLEFPGAVFGFSETSISLQN